jgi:hypothetical protein
MKQNSIIPLLMKVAPPLALAALAGLAIKEIFSGKDAENKPEMAPAKTEPEIPRKPAETAAFRSIPAEIPVKSKTNSAPVSNVVSPNSVPTAIKTFASSVSPTAISLVSAPPVEKTPAPIIPPTKTAANIPPVKRRFVLREHLAEIFKNGARPLDRKTAVAELQRLGFGQTAAYKALSPDGSFSAWLHCAPDGILSWRN